MNPFPTKNLPETNQAGFSLFRFIFLILIMLIPLAVVTACDFICELCRAPFWRVLVCTAFVVFLCQRNPSILVKSILVFDKDKGTIQFGENICLYS